jgi:glycosyltransferase involved in cell wall biosynthesis
VKVLFVSFFYPPYNTVGALRVSKLSRYLHEFGHDVRVITAAPQPTRPTLPFEIDPRLVTATSWINVNGLVEWAAGGRERAGSHGYDVGSGFLAAAKRRSADAYKALIHFPDAQIGWYPYAMRRGRQLVSDWMADVVYASGSPWTSLLVGSRLAASVNKPWVAELRDLWMDNPYTTTPSWRRAIESRLERKTLSSAAGVVTTTSESAKVVASKYRRPTIAILNGFDPGDIPEGPLPPLDRERVTIVYTGMIYEGKRDPTPLFLALRRLGPDRMNVRVLFYGRYMDGVQRIARELGVDDVVEVNSAVSYAEAMQLQARADLLLLLLWNDPREDGVCPAKIYEYVGAGRPVIVLGSTTNVAAKLVLERRLGRVCVDPEELAEHLRAMIVIKRKNGSVPRTPPDAGVGLTRKEQARALEEFLLRLVR